MGSDPSIHIIQRRIESSFPPAFVSAIPNGMSPMTVLGMLVLILSYLLYRFVFVVLVGGLLIMKTPTSAPTSSFEPPRAPYTGEHRQEQQRQNWVMEDIYKLGYNDGTNGDEYGKSLPDTSSIMSSVVDSKSTAEGLYKDDGDEPMYGSNNDHKYDNAGYDNHHNSYVPPPPPQKSKFGISSIMSLFALGNT